MRFQQAADFARFRMTAQHLFGKERLVIHAELKDATLTGDQLPRGNMHFDFPDAQDFVRHPDGAGRVASQSAVFKRDVKLQHDRVILSLMAQV